jgi:putative membrane protein
VGLVQILPTVNASLNATCAVLLLNGRARIRAGQRLQHSRFMIASLVTSTVFLACYLTLHALTGLTRFVDHRQWLRMTYLAILASHTLLAIVVVPLVLTALYLALRKRFAAHRRVVRWAYPIWLYVSVTGVVVYTLLYHVAEARGH